MYGLVSQQEVSSEVGPCVVHGSAAAEMDEALYLLLDLRDENDYEDCHIATAICYPHTQVTRDGSTALCYAQHAPLGGSVRWEHPPPALPWMSFCLSHHPADPPCRPQLTHSTNYFSSEIYRYKNRPDRMIIIYDDDERLSAPAGKLFVERGVENVYVLMVITMIILMKIV